jgi:topA_bact: DNA topoisomerase I
VQWKQPENWWIMMNFVMPWRRMVSAGRLPVLPSLKHCSNEIISVRRERTWLPPRQEWSWCSSFTKNYWNRRNWQVFGKRSFAKLKRRHTMPASFSKNWNRWFRK